MELRHRPGTQHGRRRPLHPAGLHRRHRCGRRPGPRPLQVAAFHAASRRRGTPGVCRAPEELPQGARAMNDTEARAPDPTPKAVDEQNPWLGLSSFTEETRAYFYGREEEVAELARRVQRKLLTVLFGQSGLGKTSILRAGLVPRLRGQGYCPVYVRIDYSRDSPEPAEQIKQAIQRAARRSGEWTQAGVAVAGESLWEYLHHRDDVLRDEAGVVLIPLLIFDQFE